MLLLRIPPVAFGVFRFPKESDPRISFVGRLRRCAAATVDQGPRVTVYCVEECDGVSIVDLLWSRMMERYEETSPLCFFRGITGTEM